MRAASGHDPLDALAQDHRRVLRMLDRLEATAGVAARASMLLMIKRALTAHALAEEDVLYPMLRDKVHRRAESHDLYEDHAEIKVSLYELEQLREDAQWPERVSSLRRLIEEHARKEEETEFPKLRETLDQQAMKTLAGSLQRQKMMVL
jgi:iron-sulfur cluster repair protein YtfE (RIC family)